MEANHRSASYRGLPESRPSVLMVLQILPTMSPEAMPLMPTIREPGLTPVPCGSPDDHQVPAEYPDFERKEQRFFTQARLRDSRNAQKAVPATQFGDGWREQPVELCFGSRFGQGRGHFVQHRRKPCPVGVESGGFPFHDRAELLEVLAQFIDAEQSRFNRPCSIPTWEDAPARRHQAADQQNYN